MQIIRVGFKSTELIVDNVAFKRVALIQTAMVSFALKYKKKPLSIRFDLIDMTLRPCYIKKRTVILKLF